MGGWVICRFHQVVYHRRPWSITTINRPSKLPEQNGNWRLDPYLLLCYKIAKLVQLRSVAKLTHLWWVVKQARLAGTCKHVDRHVYLCDYLSLSHDVSYVHSYHSSWLNIIDLATTTTKTHVFYVIYDPMVSSIAMVYISQITFFYSFKLPSKCILVRIDNKHCPFLSYQYEFFTLFI